MMSMPTRCARRHARRRPGREKRFARSVVPVRDVNGITLLDRDEHMRPGTDMQSLGQLNPSFAQIGDMAGFDSVAIAAHPEIEAISHVHHAGNASGIVDGAAAVLVGSRDAGTAAGLKPRARIRAFASLGSDLALMLTGPVDVTQRVLDRAGMTLSDIDLFEVNEAFSAVVLRYLQAFALDPERVNVNWRRHRHGASARRDGGDDPRHRARRTGTAGQVHRPRHPLRRGRHGHGDDHRNACEPRDHASRKQAPVTGGTHPIRGERPMELTHFRLENDADGIALAIWDMPDRSMNVFTPEVITELATIVEHVATNKTIRGCVITSGKDNFSGGADLTMLQGLRALYEEEKAKAGEAAAMRRFFTESRRLSLLFRRLETCGKPFAVAIHGLCLGGAFELALACHYRVACNHEKTRVGLPEIKVGLFPGAGGTTARGAADADGRRAADAVQGPAIRGPDGEEHGIAARCRAA